MPNTEIYCMDHETVLATVAEPTEASHLAQFAFQEGHADCGLAVVPPGLHGRLLQLASRWESAAGDEGPRGGKSAREYARVLRRTVQGTD